MRYRHTALVCAAIVAGPLAAVASAGTTTTTTTPTQNIVQVASSDPQFSTLVSLVGKAGLANTLATANVTVFAPTNAAFAKLPPALVSKLGADPVLLKRVLLSHVVQGSVPASTVVTLKQARTLSGALVKIRVSQGSVFLNGTIKVLATDVMASNGVIHVIDRVIIPPPRRTIVSVLGQNPKFSVLVGLVKKAGLADALTTGTSTVFAPNNRAFARLPKATLDAVANDPALLKAVLTYHVVKGNVSAKQALALGQATTLNGAKLTFAGNRRHVMINGSARVIHRDVRTQSGTIHVINRVLIPPR